MKQKRRLWVLIILLGISLFGISNSYSIWAQNFEKFSNKEGFNQNSVSDITQDCYGFLWYATPNGLIKYDGYEFKTFNTANTNGIIGSNVITQLYTDSKGVLWIGTSQGICVYIPWVEKFYAISLLEKIYIQKIAPGFNGQIWFSGNNKLFFCQLIDTEKGVFQISDNILKLYNENIEINDFYVKGEKEIILGTLTGLKNLSFEIDTSNNSTKNASISKYNSIENEVTKIFVDSKNILWVGTRSGLLKTTIENKRVHVLNIYGDSKDTENSPITVKTFYEDQSGFIWVGTSNDGLFKYNPEEDFFEHFKYDPKNKSGLSSPFIKALFQDNFKVLWIGTAHGGINKLDITPKTFINYSNNPFDPLSISDNLITSILEDSKGRLWISGYNNPLVRSTTLVSNETIDDLKFENLENQIPITDDDIVRCIYEDNKGYIWLGTEYSVIVYNPKTNIFKKVIIKSEGIEKNTQTAIRSIYQLDDNNVLLAGNYISVIENPWNEILKSKTPQLKIKSVINLNPERAQCILKDTNNTFWIGTSNGLLHTSFDGKNIIINQKYTDNKNDKVSLSNNNVFSLFKDNKDYLWIGTFGGGLNKLHLNKEGVAINADYFRKKDTLPDDVIYGILQQDESHLWLSTDMGLINFNTDKNTVNVYDVRDGLIQNNFRENSYSKSKTGYFYFGGLNGLTVFKPERIQLNLQPPKILISHLLVNNKYVKIDEKLNNKVVLDKSILETESISLSQNQQIISFNVVVQHTSTPSKNKFAYKLEGFNNDDWVENESGKATITYTNLSAGNYVFKVKAANGDGVWSETSKNLNLKILPPWYNTWWSYLIFFIITIAFTLGIILYFVGHERLKQRLIYETLDKERTEQINQGKFRYFTNLSHEFRTPLTLISGPIEHMLKHNTDSKNNKYLAIVQKNTERLLSLVNQLITFRQAEEGRIYLNLVKYTLGDFIYPITEAFENYAIEKNINFFYKVSNTNEEIIIDVEKMERIVFNLLSNSFKNTPLQGNISIEAKINFEADKKRIQIDVIDTGKGIPKENLDNIFERFYQLGNNDGKISGGGIGLSFCKSLANLLGGSITASSSPGIETRFSVIIPSKSTDDFDLDKRENSNKSFIKNWVPLSPDIIDTENIIYDTENKKQNSILVVENEVDVQNFLKSTLSEKYQITIANNGKEALEKIKLNEPDLIISDVMMPEMDGYELCEKIKSNSITCHLPIILLTALGENENLIKGLEFGADEYISKPFSLKHLQLRIKKLIQYKAQIKEYFSKNSQFPKDKKDIKISIRDEKFLKKTINIIEKNLSDSSFGVEELSKETGYSNTHFYRRLKQLTGQVPNVYIRNYRLQRAAELLKNNNGHNVSEVMYQIGIESNSHFSTSFKKLYGLSPSEFVKSDKPA